MYFPSIENIATILLYLLYTIVKPFLRLLSLVDIYYIQLFFNNSETASSNVMHQT